MKCGKCLEYGGYFMIGYLFFCGRRMELEYSVRDVYRILLVWWGYLIF